jgi:hypothetical protein
MLVSEPIAFRSGKDLGEETRTGCVDTVTCSDCGRVESDENAYAAGWQLRPVVCPDCLRWTLTDRGRLCTG